MNKKKIESYIVWLTFGATVLKQLVDLYYQFFSEENNTPKMLTNEEEK